jgi:hypothetical protein
MTMTMAHWTMAAWCSARHSQSRAVRRQRLIQARVRSITHLRNQSLPRRPAALYGLADAIS